MALGSSGSVVDGSSSDKKLEAAQLEVKKGLDDASYLQNGNIASHHDDDVIKMTTLKPNLIPNGTNEAINKPKMPVENGDSSITKCSELKSSITNNNVENGVIVNGTQTANGYIEDEIDGDEPSAKPSAKDDTDSTKDQEVVFIQEMGFNVRIQSPGVEPFDIQVSSVELVQEIHQLLMDREDTCHRTCFSLQLDNVTLDNFAELKNIEGLKEGSVIKVVEEPYTVREARIHVRHIRDLLKALDLADAYNGVDCNSLSFLNIITQGDIMEKKKNRPDSVDCTPPDYIMPGVKDRPIMPLYPNIADQKLPQALKVLTTSGWNPPPAPRKMKGDLLYLYVVTLEDKRFHITACTRGFFINQSSEEEFNPRAVNPKQVSHSLVDLLSQISPSFKRNFVTMQRKRTQKHPFERVATPYQLYSWMAPQLDHSIDAIRAEDAFSSKLGYEEHIPGQTRDWNEELQTTRELPRKTLPERLLRERAIFKVHSDFVAAATRGAMAVIDGNVMAINPGEEAKMQMFIWNNIFFSLGFDVRDHYKELGGDAAAFIAPKNDLQGVKVYNAVDQDGLYTLGTVVIDYRGYRVTAQSIIPGILEREQEQSVVYGSIDFGKTIVTHEKYLELLNKAGQQLKVLPHKILNADDEAVELCSSVECKGIIGNDGRHYILDLLRTFPPDVNFLKVDDPLSDEIKKMGFPIEHKHKLSCLRQELIDAFVESRYMTFIRCVAYQLQQLNLMKNVDKEDQKQIEGVKDDEDTPDKKVIGKNEEIDVKKLPEIEELIPQEISEKLAKKDDESFETDAAKKIVESIGTESGDKTELEANTKEIIEKACQAIGSLKPNEFYMRFNPDVYSPGLKHPNPEGEDLKNEKKLIHEAAEFLVTVQIPGLVRDFLEHQTTPVDGSTLSDAMHNRGINIRYLGKLADFLEKIPQLEYIYDIAVSELISRSVKHLFTSYVQGVDMMNLSAAICHFLNCYLSSCNSPHAPLSPDELPTKNNKKKNRKKGKMNPLAVQDNEWAMLTPKLFWSQLKSEGKTYFDWTMNADAIDDVTEKYNIHKLSLLRQFNTKIGLQLLFKEYNFDNKSKQTFYEEDIMNIFPVVKHINPRATDAFNFYTTGQSKIQQGYLKEGYELISEALNLLNNVYGAMHPEIAQCLRMLARLNYIMGDHAEAMSFQQKAVFMSERVNGPDHPFTITEYTHLALYCFANSQVTTALKLLYRARYLALIVCCENHPEVALLDSNIGLILHAVGEYDLSLRFLENALKLNIKYFSTKSLKVAVSYHLVARTQSCMGDFRGALQNEKETFAIYKQQLGEEHEKTKESSECLKHLTQQAVVLQKKMNELYKGTSGAALPPIQIQPPSMGSVLDMLNVINGILFVQISQKDIENFKAEFEQRQSKESIKAKTESDESEEGGASR